MADLETVDALIAHIVGSANCTTTVSHTQATQCVQMARANWASLQFEGSNEQLILAAAEIYHYGAQAPAIVPEPQASASAAAFPADVLYFLMGLLAHSAEDASTLRFRVSGVSKAWRRAASEAGKQARRALLPARTQTHTHAQKRTRTHTHARTRMHIVRMCACS